MDNTFYPSEEVFEPKRESFSMPRSVQNDRHEVADKSAQMSPTPEVDNKNRNTRRRNTLACIRCRKRKIRCSDDNGDGQGCSNCRTSGNASNCEYLRVNAKVLPKMTAWPYPPMGAVSQSRRSGMYSHMAKPAVPMNSSGLRINPFSRLGYDMGPVESQNGYSRHLSLDHGVPYQDDAAFEQSYMYPAQGPSLDYCMPWNDKAWNSAFTGKGEVVYSEDAASSMTQAYPYMLPTTATPATEMSRLVPTMAIPSEGQGIERSLPNPSRSQRHSMSVLPPTPENAHTVSFQDRLGNQWAPRAPVGIRASMQPTMNGAGSYSTSPATQAKPSPSIPQDISFGYLPLSEPSNLSSTTPNGLEIPDQDDFHAPEPRLTRSYSHTHNSPRTTNTNTHTHTHTNNVNTNRLVSLTCTPDIYGYSTSEKSKRSEDASSTLMNGLPYTRVRHAESNNPLSFSLLPTDPAIQEYRTPAMPEVHRTSISPLGNGY